MGEDRLRTFGEIKISDIMVNNPLYTTPNEKISKTELLMLRKNINGLPVVDDTNKVIGIITQRDIRLARFAISIDSSKTIVRNLMTPEPYTIKANDNIKKALQIMFENNIERLPVVNDNNELIGLVLEKIILHKLLEYLK
ncbi:MAG: CBS domain-containing protein [Promethearchaeota archaeon]|nr:MAG: CBS domain-containing protein [Candidatus Lokiarchaeota archaeon]